jgi:hypothetical protein
MHSRAQRERESGNVLFLSGYQVVVLRLAEPFVAATLRVLLDLRISAMTKPV